MSTEQSLDRYLARYPAVAVVGYVAFVAACAFMTWAAPADVYDRYVALAAATDMLDQLEGHKSVTGGVDGAAPAGSPFLEGQTVTVAGAVLQQRVTGAVTTVGGEVLSSQVELQRAQSTTNGLVSLVTSCEVSQPALQKLLYDIEAGMPFLFVDQLVVEAQQPGTRQESGRMRVLLGVSGQWQGAK